MNGRGLAVAALGAVAVGAGIAAVVIERSKRRSPPPPPAPDEIPVYGLAPGVNLIYLTKYTAQALQLAALPSPSGPVMLCSYLQPLREVEEEIRREEQTKREREEARDRARDEKVALEVAKIQRRIDSAVRNKNASTLADIYTSTKIQQISGYRLSPAQALAALDRDTVWNALGLWGPDGYVLGADAKEILDEMRWGRRIPSDREGVRFDYAPLPWPAALGGGTAKTRGG